MLTKHLRNIVLLFSAILAMANISLADVEVSGYVYDSYGKALDGVAVTTSDDYKNYSESTRYGKYSIELLAGNKYTLTYKKFKYIETTQDVDLTDSNPANSFSMTIPKVVMSDAPSVSISGNVVNKKGVPLPGVSVRIKTIITDCCDSEDDSYPMLERYSDTDEDGHFELLELYPEEYILTALKKGYEKYYQYGFKVLSGQNEEIEIVIKRKKK